MKEHTYSTSTEWTGNTGEGTLKYNSFNRDHIISAPNKFANILASSDPSFRGNPERYNPEELLVSSISSCHMLWYLHLCSTNKVIVLKYEDQCTGVMKEFEDGSGKFKEVSLHPEVVVQDESMIEKALELHEKAHELCFIANSCNFDIKHFPIVSS